MSNKLSVHHKVLASVELLQHARADLHVVPRNWIGHRLNGIHGQKVIHSDQLIWTVDIKRSQFPAKLGKKLKNNKKHKKACYQENRKEGQFKKKTFSNNEIKRYMKKTK